MLAPGKKYRTRTPAWRAGGECLRRSDPADMMSDAFDPHQAEVLSSCEGAKDGRASLSFPASTQATAESAVGALAATIRSSGVGQARRSSYAPLAGSVRVFSVQRGDLRRDPVHPRNCFTALAFDVRVKVGQFAVQRLGNLVEARR
ncbi:MAG: hypothetical protein OXN89_04190 [Bryobacterales bacterium]|nr:hypothetical protein [Bryobacterales bacterium]